MTYKLKVGYMPVSPAENQGDQVKINDLPGLIIYFTMVIG